MSFLNRRVLVTLTTLLLVSATSGISGCASTRSKEVAKESKSLVPAAWIAESNQIAEEYGRSWAEIIPESGSGLGYREYDARATRLDDMLEGRVQALLVEWKKSLSDRLQATSDPEVKIDIRVLIDDVEQSLRGKILDDKYGEIPFDKVADGIFYSLRDLINEQSPAERKQAAVERFRLYVRGFQDGQNKSRPRAIHAKINTEKKLKLFSKKTGPSGGRLFLPLRAEVENYLKNSKKIVEGIEGVLADSGRTDWKEDYAAFKIQMVSYDNWVRTVILPMSRKDHKLPAEIYALALNRMGNRLSPSDNREVARKAFVIGLVEYRDLAAKIAKRDGLKDATPKGVLKHLKQNVETNPEKIREGYVQANAELSADILKRDLVSLPPTALRIRVASEAESRIQPVPHLDTPPLIGNTGERPEFVVPIGSKDKLAFDDFSYAAAAKSLTAHEGRPGHDLQFGTVLDRGVSTIRAHYAFNSVNVEGWGLYAEWLMEPSFTLDEHFALLMARMMRNARMFLDPELHLGLITPAQAKKVITDEVAMSPEWAELELQRYMYKSPAQAPSYYYGYLKLREIRDETVKRMGAGFRERCFHDAILNEGLLPLDILAEKMRELHCSTK
jgi:hypothetical protein